MVLPETWVVTWCQAAASNDLGRVTWPMVANSVGPSAISIREFDVPVPEAAWCRTSR